MLDNSQNILRLASAAAVLLVGSSVAYHYIIYIPNKDEATRNQLLAKEDLAMKDASEKARRDETARKAKETAALFRRTAYQVCVSNAQADYSARWDASCKTHAAASARNRQNCVARGVAEATCLEWNPVPPASCELSNALADDYGKDLDDEKDRCFRVSTIEATATG